MASGTGGYNAAAYGDNGWNDGALITESGIAADLVLGSETPQANADVTEGTTPELGLNVSLSSKFIKHLIVLFILIVLFVLV